MRGTEIHLKQYMSDLETETKQSSPPLGYEVYVNYILNIYIYIYIYICLYTYTWSIINIWIHRECVHELKIILHINVGRGGFHTLMLPSLPLYNCIGIHQHPCGEEDFTNVCSLPWSLTLYYSFCCSRSWWVVERCKWKH